MELHSVQLKSKRRINIDLPGGMVEKLDELASHGNCSRSELIRILISEKRNFSKSPGTLEVMTTSLRAR